MRLLSIVHEPDAGAELFADIVAAEGHELEEWSIVDEPAPPRPVEGYDAVFSFGGAMNVDEEDDHPWLRDEDRILKELVARSVPFLGVCLGGQLLAKAGGAHVGPASEHELGFVRVELTDEAANDPLFGSLPRELDLFAAHGYAFHVPQDAVELARSAVCSQAFRVGERAWGIQFHPEVRVEQVARWLRDDGVPNADAVVAELRERYDDWAAFGAFFCRAFLSTVSEFVALSH